MASEALTVGIVNGSPAGIHCVVVVVHNVGSIVDLPHLRDSSGDLELRVAEGANAHRHRDILCLGRSSTRSRGAIGGRWGN